MHVTSAKQFQAYVFKQLTFTAFPTKNYIRYENPDRPELGYCCLYERPDCYQLGIADYTIPDDFMVSFSNPTKQLRFGTLFYGKTHFKLQHESASSFTPASFLVMENNLKGQQAWKKGEHFCGIELTIYEPYLEQHIAPYFSDCVHFCDFIPNHTYKFLPEKLNTLFYELQTLHAEGFLTPLYLEGLVLQSVALLAKEFLQKENAFSETASHKRIAIGKDRYLTIDLKDRKAAALAHEILTEHYKNPPTIPHLSEQVLLSSQKLKYAFFDQYHISIPDYVTSLRMTHAASLLRTTTLSVEEIGKETGYHYAANFIKMFKKTYGQTPLQFRLQESLPEKF